MSSIHTVEYYSALKRKEILTTWMNFEDMMLSKRSQIQKNTHCLIPLTRGPRGVRSTETGSIWWGQGLGGGDGESSSSESLSCSVVSDSLQPCGL